MISLAKKIRTQLKVFLKRSYVTVGENLHLGRGVRLWAPDHIKIGSHVYIGGNSHIEANCHIGNFCLLANEVALLGKYDHDYREIGKPIRYATWVGEKEKEKNISTKAKEDIVIDDEVWIGFRSIILSGVTIGKGSIVAAGSIVTKDVPPYSIVAGSPARVVGNRFNNLEVEKHEELMTEFAPN